MQRSVAVHWARHIEQTRMLRAIKKFDPLKRTWFIVVFLPDRRETKLYTVLDVERFLLPGR